MRIASIAAVSLASILVAGVLTAAVQEKKGGDKPEKKEMPKHESALVDSATAKYIDAPVPGVSRAVISGDPEKGAYRVFTKFAPGVTHPMHSHPNEIWLVVIKGAYVHKAEGAEEVRVGPGCAFHIPAGQKHVSGGDAKEGVVMLEESNEKFGMDLADKAKEKEKEKK